MIKGLRRSATFVFMQMPALIFAGALAAAQHTGAAANSPRQSAIQSPFAAADTLLREGSIAEARQKIQELLALHPDSVAGYNLLGIVDSGEKDYSGALEAFQHALKLSPNSAKTHNNLGNLYVVQNHPELAEKEFHRVLRLNPSDKEGNYNLGLLLLAKGSPRSAIPYFQRVHPANTGTKFNLIRCYFESGQNAVGLSLARTLSTQNKDDVQLHFTLGVLLAEVKQYRESQLELEKANALQPETFEILYNLGRAYLRSREFTKAEVTLNRALKLKPDSADTLYSLGQVYAEQTKAVDALDVLVRAHKLAPENVDVIFLLARVSMTQNYFEDAIPLLESGLKLAPQRSDLHAALGESYFMAGKADKAIEEFKSLIVLDPSARSYAFLGLSYRSWAASTRPRNIFRRASSSIPTTTPACSTWVTSKNVRGTRRAPRRCFRKHCASILTIPTRCSNSLIYASQRRISPNAAELLRRYVKSSRNPATGYYKLAMVERSLHQSEAAQRDLSVFQTLSKNASTGPYPYNISSTISTTAPISLR